MMIQRHLITYLFVLVIAAHSQLAREEKTTANLPHELQVASGFTTADAPGGSTTPGPRTTNHSLAV